MLQRIAARIQEDKRQQANLRAFREEFASSGRFLKERLLQELFSGAAGSAAAERARALQMNLLANRYLVMLLRPSQPVAVRDELLQVKSVLQRLADMSGGTAHLCESGEQFAFLVLGDNEGDLEERAYGLAQAAQYDVERNTGRKLLVAIGNAAASLEDIPIPLPTPGWSWASWRTSGRRPPAS